MVLIAFPAMGQDASGNGQSSNHDGKGPQRSKIDEQAIQDLPCPLGRYLTEEVKYRNYVVRTYRYPNPLKVASEFPRPADSSSPYLVENGL